jgi:hypothetical protein
MSELPTISPSPPALHSMDYERLRQIGMEHIRRLAARSWTDHNSHDPGITMLKVLAYAITDLGHRLHLPIADILRSQPGGDLEKLQSALPGATSVLPNAAYTERDLRKLFMVVEGVRNAYLEKGEAETGIFYDTETRTLSTAAGSDGERLALNGLYSLVLELDEDEDGIDLNSVLVETSIVANGNTYAVALFFPLWDSWVAAWRDVGYGISNVTVVQLFLVGDGQNENFFAELNLDVNNPAATPPTVSTGPFRVDIQVAPPIDPVVDPAIEADMIAALDGLLTALTPDNPLFIYKARAEAIGLILGEVESVFHANRNLCEDLVGIRGIRFQELAIINTIIDLLPGADPNRVLAEAFFALEQFICPAVRRYSFQELWERGMAIEDILQGPLLPRNLFILDADLGRWNRIRTVYASDLFSVLMDVEGVFAVRGLRIVNFVNNNNLVPGGAIDCLRLLDGYIPKFSAARSEVRLRLGEVEMSIDPAAVESHLAALRRAARPMAEGAPFDLPIPSGDKLELDLFHSIQEEFPLHYGIGSPGLPAAATEERQAQARQLQGYLTIFDQVLANCAAQIANLCEFFSAESEIDRTYYYMPVYRVPRVHDLLQAFLVSGMSMEDFIANRTNEYITRLEAHTEDEATFLDRRSRLLDHLLARFGEVFPRWSELMYFNLNLHYIQDKIRFFAGLHAIYSPSRAQAFNYSPGSLGWDSANVAGIQKRVARLIGLEDYNRRSLSAAIDPNDHFVFFDIPPPPAQRGFRLSEDDEVLFESNGFPTQADAEDAALRLLRVGLDRSHYHAVSNIITVDDSLGTIGRIEVNLPAGADEEQLQQIAINRLRNALLRIHIEEEGLFLVEHLLLRPRQAADALLTNVFDERDDSPLRDPYSFRATWVLPSGYSRDFGDDDAVPVPRDGLARMRSLEFRQFLKHLIRLETPANILPQIYFLDTDSNTPPLAGDTPSLNHFERVYQDWIAALTADAPPSTPADLASARDALVAVLNSIILSNPA